MLAEGNFYATITLEDPEQSEWYSIFAKVNGLNKAHIAAVKDFMTRPEIESLNTKAYKGNVGDVIHITPKLLLKVTKIDVTIYSPDGNVLETGQATKRDFHWQYTAIANNPHVDGTRIVLVAHDRLRKSCRFTEHINDEVKTSFVASSYLDSSTPQLKAHNIFQSPTGASPHYHPEKETASPISENQRAGEFEKQEQSSSPVTQTIVNRQVYREHRLPIASQSQKEYSVHYSYTPSPFMTFTWEANLFQRSSCTHPEESLSLDKYI